MRPNHALLRMNRSSCLEDPGVGDVTAGLRAWPAPGSKSARQARTFGESLRNLSTKAAAKFA